jgi:hypothetical protein
MLGLNRSGDFANGNPIILPHTFGNPVTLPNFCNINKNAPISREVGALCIWGGLL